MILDEMSEFNTTVVSKQEIESEKYLQQILENRLKQAICRRPMKN